LPCKTVKGLLSTVISWDTIELTSMLLETADVTIWFSLNYGTAGTPLRCMTDSIEL
jgi:hypothetical protein